MGILSFFLGLSFSFQVSLDAHVHFQTSGIINRLTENSRAITEEDTFQHFESVLKQKYLDRFFLLSEAYLEPSLEAANKRNIDVTAIAKEEPRAIPVCSADLRSSFFETAITNCEYANMRGFKFHLRQSRLLLNHETSSKLTRAFSHLSKQKKYFVLIHFHNETRSKEESQEQAIHLVALAESFKNIQFIIAHAGADNPELLQQVIAVRGSAPIFTETSTLFSSFGVGSDGALRTYYGYSLSYYQDLLTKFGISNVLYGSDTFIENPANTNEIEFILNSTFSFYEQDRILYQNGKDFLSQVQL